MSAARSADRTHALDCGVYRGGSCSCYRRAQAVRIDDDDVELVGLAEAVGVLNGVWLENKSC